MFCCVVIDVNECANNNGNCHSQANCKNTPGTFTCTCLDGYSGDGITCSGKEWTIVLYFTLLRKFYRRIRTLATTYCRLLLVLRNTKCTIQLIMIITRYCGDNHVWNLVNFSLYLRLYNISKYFRQLFTSMGKITAQQGWHDIYRRFIFATKISYLIYIQFFTHENIGSPVNLASNQLGDNQLGDRCRSTGRQCPQYIYAFCARVYFG